MNFNKIMKHSDYVSRVAICKFCSHTVHEFEIPFRVKGLVMPSTAPRGKSIVSSLSDWISVSVLGPLQRMGGFREDELPSGIRQKLKNVSHLKIPVHCELLSLKSSQQPRRPKKIHTEHVCCRLL